MHIMEEGFDPGRSRKKFLARSNFKGEVICTEETIFTVKAAKAIGVPGPEILKSILLRVDKEVYFVLALISDINRLDIKK